MPDAIRNAHTLSTDPHYWGRDHGHDTISSQGTRLGWGVLMAHVVETGRRVLIRRARYGRVDYPTTPAVLVPYDWWVRKTRQHPAAAWDEMGSKRANLATSAVLDRVEDEGVHMVIRRLRSEIVVFTPRAWYEAVTGRDVSTPHDARKVSGQGARGKRATPGDGS